MFIIRIERFSFTVLAFLCHCPTGLVFILPVKLYLGDCIFAVFESSSQVGYWTEHK